MKKVRISDESVNCYGTRILTSGISLDRYQRNPVLLYMHERGKVVGLVRNLEVKGGELLGELCFDKASKLSEQLAKQYDFGSMKMVSANFRILETSDDKSLVQEGQTAQTVTRCELFEVSCVDIGGNDNALVLSDHEGNAISLVEGSGNLLPLLNDNNNPYNTEQEMEKKQLALMLGLSETATEAEISTKIEELKLAAVKAARLKKRVDEMQLAGIIAAVDTAVKEKRIAATLKDHFTELGKKVGLESLQLTLGAMQPQTKISDLVHRESANVGQAVVTGTPHKLSEVSEEELMELRNNNHAEYVRLYKAEYGFAPELV